MFGQTLPQIVSPRMQSLTLHDMLDSLFNIDLPLNFVMQRTGGFRVGGLSKAAMSKILIRYL